jgi:pyrroloquinoline quinone (PQQ) biosynthesis protein C
MNNQLNTYKADEIFSKKLNELYLAHLPSKHPFFQRLATFPEEKLRSPHLLGQLHLRYQAACHATRVMIYQLPHLDSPALRVRKLKFIMDDDGPTNGDIHHYQLSRAFNHIGTALVIDDEEFGSLNKLQDILDPATSDFLSLMQELYPKSLGPWCVIEAFSDNWMRALMDSLSACFPSIKEEPYFAECFDRGIEERHAQEALSLTSIVLNRSPELLENTIEGARLTAAGLDEFWAGLDNLLKAAFNCSDLQS